MTTKATQSPESLGSRTGSAPDVGDWVRSIDNPRIQGLVIEEECSVVLVDLGHAERWINKANVEVCDAGDYDTDRDKPWLRKFLSSIESNTQGQTAETE